MPSTTITGSVNVSLLDSKIDANLCLGKFYLDISPSIFIGTGASSVLGIKVQVKNPAGAIIKDYGVSYDAAPPLSGGLLASVAVNIPTKGGKYQYGVYTFSIELTDQNGTKYYVTKSKNICAYPDEDTFCKSAIEMIANCQAGTLTILMAEPLTYQGKVFQSRTQNWIISYPTSSGLTTINSNIGNFAIQLFEGVYKIVGSTCVTYNMGDNIFVSIGFSGNWEKNVKCVLDYTCIFPQLERIGQALNQECSTEKIQEVSNIILNTLWLLKKIEITLASGEDASDDITDLEKLLGCNCTCDCDASSPIINNAPSSLIQITGCNVGKETVGLTDIYTIENYEFLIDVDPTQSLISVSAPSLINCTKTQRITLNLPAIYSAVKTQLTGNSEFNFWGSIVNKTIDEVDPTCLGLTALQWSTMTFKQRTQAIIDTACAGGKCSGTVIVTPSKVGSDVILSLAISNAFSVDIYVDNVFMGNVLAAGTSIKLLGYADGLNHDYVAIPKCANGSMGITTIGIFQYISCAHIEPLSVSSNNVNGADCPYSLTSLLAAIPVGLTAEWHTANNTNTSSLVANPAAVPSGIYFVFAKDGFGCYSIGVQVQVICAAASDCSEPQNLSVSAITGGFLVQFQSAAFPPPLNSYTVKRRLASDPDVSGSYTTIGTPTFNATTSRWEILDPSAFPRTLYVYQAISNCASTSPSVQFQFANMNCQVITFTPSTTSIHYSFTNPLGGITKYIVRIYDVTGTILLQANTHLVSIPGTVTGDFIYLGSGTSYRVRLEQFIGTYSQLCPFVNTATIGENYALSASFNFSIQSVTGAGVPALPPTGLNTTLNGNQTGMSGSYAIVLAGSVLVTTKLVAYVNGIQVACVAVPSAGTYNLSITAASTDTVRISVDSGIC